VWKGYPGHDNPGEESKRIEKQCEDKSIGRSAQ